MNVSCGPLKNGNQNFLSLSTDMSLETAVSLQPKLNLESVITQGGHVTTASEREAVQGTGDEACLSIPHIKEGSWSLPELGMHLAMVPF